MLLYSCADIVQWLVCGLAKAKMRVRFSLFAPFENLISSDRDFFIHDI